MLPRGTQDEKRACGKICAEGHRAWRRGMAEAKHPRSIAPLTGLIESQSYLASSAPFKLMTAFYRKKKEKKNQPQYCPCFSYRYFMITAPLTLKTTCLLYTLGTPNAKIKQHFYSPYFERKPFSAPSTLKFLPPYNINAFKGEYYLSSLTLSDTKSNTLNLVFE